MRRQGKRTRRAMIRLRHSTARKWFIRRATPQCVPIDTDKPSKWLPRLWHALGCP